MPIKENLKTIIVSAPCTNAEEEIILNQQIFAFNELESPNAIKGVGEKDFGLPYVVEVLIEENNVHAFINYLSKTAPEAKIQEKE